MPSGELPSNARGMTICIAPGFPLMGENRMVDAGHLFIDFRLLGDPQLICIFELGGIGVHGAEIGTWPVLWALREVDTLSDLPTVSSRLAIDGAVFVVLISIGFWNGSETNEGIRCTRL